MTSFRVSVRTILLFSLIFVIGGKFSAGLAYSVSTYSPVDSVNQEFEVTPDQIVILSNAADWAYYKDFSTLLKWSNLERVILENSDIPETVKDKHILLIGELGSPFTGKIIAELITPEERKNIKKEGQYAILNKESPWREDRLIIVASGSDENTTKKAAEEALTDLMRGVKDLGQWYMNPYESVSREEAAGYMREIQYAGQGEELPRDLLMMDVKSNSPLWISRERAIEDVERVFYLLEYGWCGYGYFSHQGDFDLAKVDILAELSAKSGWTPNGLSQLIYKNLDFIHDCHLRLGDKAFCRHIDFWYAENMDVEMADGGYVLRLDGIEYIIQSVNGESPDSYLFPSLDAVGNPVYRLGILAYDPQCH